MSIDEISTKSSKKENAAGSALIYKQWIYMSSPYSRVDLDEDRRKKITNRGGGGEGGDGRRVGGGRGGQGGGGTMSKTPPG